MSEFWLDNPCVLLQDMNLFPTKDMTKNERLNALSRLILLVAAYLYYQKNDYWYVFLGLTMIVVFAQRYNTQQEGFNINPTYSGNVYHQTAVAPMFAEEYHNPPPAYDQYDLLDGNDYELFEDTPRDLDPRSYPYGQYLTRTNLLPRDEEDMRLANRGLTQSRHHYNNTWTRQRIGFQDEMMRIHRKKLERRFRHNTNDNFSPFHST